MRAAVVGVIADLALWFSLNVLFGELTQESWGPVTLEVPTTGSLDVGALALTVVCLVLVLGLKWGLLRVLAFAATAGLVLSAIGAHP